MSIITTFLVWYGIISAASVIGIICMVVYDRIKYGPLESYKGEDF